MAVFNPDVPNKDAPSYLGISKAIEQPQGDATLGTALKGIGDTFSLAVKGADEVIKGKIQDEVYSKADIQRQVYTSELEGAKQTGNPLDIIPQGTDQNVPDGVKAGVDQGISLTSSRANGKISGTYYWGRLNELSKSLRAQYPGYREYIDQQFSSVTGHNPANAYMQSLAGDLNASATSARADKAKIETMFNSPEIRGNPGLRELHAQWAAGLKSNEEAWQKISIASELAWKAQQSNAKISLYNNNKTFIASESAKVADDDANSAISNYLDTITLPNGANAKEFVGKMLRNEVQVSDDQARSIGTYLRSFRAKAESELWTKWNKPDSSGESMVNRLGGSKAAKELLDQHMKTFDQINESIYNSNFGAAFMLKNFVASKIDSGKAILLQDVRTRDVALKLAVIQSIAGPNYVKDVFQSILGTDAPAKFKEFMDNEILDLHTQYNPLDTLPGGTNNPAAPPVKTFEESVRRTKSKGVGDPSYGSPVEEGAPVYKGILKQINTITSDAPDQLKINIAKAAFDPRGRGLMGLFDQEAARGLFQTFTSPAVTKEMFRLSQTNPKLWDDYKDSVDTWFSRVVFRNEIFQLDQLSSSPNLALTWDSNKAQWGIKPKYIMGQMNLNETDMLKVNRTVKSLNDGIANVKNMTDASNTDINAYLLGQFQALQIDPKNSPAMRALTSAIKKPEEKPKAPQPPRKTELEQPQAAQFALADIVPSLAEWMQSPAKAPPGQLRLNRKTGKYEPYEDSNTTSGKDQERVGK